MHFRSGQMAQRSKENWCSWQLFCLQGDFTLRPKPFGRPLGFGEFCPIQRQESLKYAPYSCTFLPRLDQNSYKLRVCI
jgi:hypothetical protein